MATQKLLFLSGVREGGECCTVLELWSERFVVVVASAD
jgi:hypothetical protein